MSARASLHRPYAPPPKAPSNLDALSAHLRPPFNPGEPMIDLLYLVGGVALFLVLGLYALGLRKI